MQFSTLLALLSAVAAPALAAPVANPDTANMMVDGEKWIIQSFKRTSGDGVVTYDYSINQNNQVTKCNYEVKGKQAARASYEKVPCGPYTISSNWSAQFGDENGFQTLAIVNGKQIVYPAYTDKQLVSGKVVTPDQSYTPQNLPN